MSDIDEDATPPSGQMAVWQQVVMGVLMIGFGLAEIAHVLHTDIAGSDRLLALTVSAMFVLMGLIAFSIRQTVPGGRPSFRLTYGLTSLFCAALSVVFEMIAWHCGHLVFHGGLSVFGIGVAGSSERSGRNAFGLFGAVAALAALGFLHQFVKAHRAS